MRLLPILPILAQTAIEVFRWLTAVFRWITENRLYETDPPRWPPHLSVGKLHVIARLQYYCQHVHVKPWDIRPTSRPAEHPHQFKRNMFTSSSAFERKSALQRFTAVVPLSPDFFVRCFSRVHMPWVQFVFARIVGPVLKTHRYTEAALVRQGEIRAGAAHEAELTKRQRVNPYNNSL